MPITGGVFFDNPPGWYESGNIWPTAMWPYLVGGLQVLPPIFTQPPVPAQAYVGRSTLGDVFSEASLLLNDVNNTIYTAAALLGYSKKAFLELEMELLNYGLPVT